MSIPTYLRTIGRGRDGAKPLDESQAEELFGAALDQHLSGVQLGAFLMAMRIKSETTAELSGFVRAAQQRCMAIPSECPVIVLPSYNGARKLPLLTPLLAQYLAHSGHRVLVHGPQLDPARLTSAQLFTALGWPQAETAAQVLQAWAQGQAVFVPVTALCPALAQMLDLRASMGLRGPGHTVVKLLSPVAPSHSVRVVNYTHSEYAVAHREYLSYSLATALLLRGTEGEPVADPRRLPALEAYLRGEQRPDLSFDKSEAGLKPLNDLPPASDLEATARYTQLLLSDPQRIPEPLLAQATCLAALCVQLAVRAAP